MTGIEMTDETWNPVSGCTKVSPGCDHCYAESNALRFRKDFEDVTLHPQRLDKPKYWKKPRNIFVNSMGDLFHPEVPLEFIRKVFDAIAETPQHIYQISTKRHSRLAELANVLPWHDNIWMGVSVENQDYIERVDRLRQVPAKIRFLSCEPLLGPLQLDLTEIDWVIVSGECGPKHRPIDIEWVRGIRDQCLAANVPFFFRQWGGRDSKFSGRELDGRIWIQTPLQAIGKIGIETEEEVLERFLVAELDASRDDTAQRIAQEQAKLQALRLQLSSCSSPKVAKRLKKDCLHLERNIQDLIAYRQMFPGETVTKKSGEIGIVTGKYFSPGGMPGVWVKWDDGCTMSEHLTFLEKVRWSGWDWSEDGRIVRFNLNNRSQLQECNSRSFLVQEMKALEQLGPQLVERIEGAIEPKKEVFKLQLSASLRKLDYIRQRLTTLSETSSGTNQPTPSNDPLKVDLEFKSLIPPLSKEEYNQLETNILAYGCRDPLIIWKGYNIILDGYNRYEICTRLGIPFKTVEIYLPDRNAALNWLIENQLGRRNLTPEAISYLRGQRYHLLKASVKNPFGRKRSSDVCGQSGNKQNEDVGGQSEPELNEGVCGQNGKKPNEFVCGQSGNKQNEDAGGQSEPELNEDICGQNGKKPNEFVCGQSGNKQNEDVGGQSGNKLRTVEFLAKEYKVGSRTIGRDAKFAQAVDILAATVGRDVRPSILSRNAQLTKKKTLELAALAKQNPEAVRKQFDKGRFVGKSEPDEKPLEQIFQIGEVVSVVLEKNARKVPPLLKGKNGYWAIVTGVNEKSGTCSIDLCNCSIEVVPMKDLKSLGYSKEECDRMQHFRDRLVRLSQVGPDETTYSILINLGKLKRPFTAEEVRLLEFLEGEYGLLDNRVVSSPDDFVRAACEMEEDVFVKTLRGMASSNPALFHKVAEELSINLHLN